MKFGELLRKIRKSNNLTLDGLSILSGINKSTLCKIENSDLKPPASLESMEKLLSKSEFSDMEKFDLIQAARNYYLEEVENRFKRPSS